MNQQDKATFKIHKEALPRVSSALQRRSIKVRARQIEQRIFLVSICPTRKNCALDALIDDGYGHITFCQTKS